MNKVRNRFASRLTPTSIANLVSFGFDPLRLTRASIEQIGNANEMKLAEGMGLRKKKGDLPIL